MSQKVLLIDDEQDLTELLKTLLEFHHLESEAFNDPIRAEKAIRAHPYHLIVTDLMMPGLDGFMLIEKIRGTRDYEKTPIIALSAKTLTDEERKVLLKNEIHLITKPFEPQDLVGQITELLKSP